ncbi:protein YpfM [Acerihabitans sp. TG2]
MIDAELVNWKAFIEAMLRK